LKISSVKRGCRRSGVEVGVAVGPESGTQM